MKSLVGKLVKYEGAWYVVLALELSQGSPPSWVALIMKYGDGTMRKVEHFDIYCQLATETMEAMRP